MCARFTLFTPGAEVAKRFLLADVPALVPRYNIAPSQSIPVIGGKAGGHGRGLAMFKWGFVPHWTQNAPTMKPVNAKSETVANSPMFGDSFRKRRCLVPASGFYEWRTVAKKKIPVWFHLKDKSPFGFAGVWDVWQGPAGKVFTVAILTTTPNEVTLTVHDRMPVIIKPEDEAIWLEPSIEDTARLQPLVGPYPADLMAAEQGNPALNKPSFEGSDCLSPSA